MDIEGIEQAEADPAGATVPEDPSNESGGSHVKSGKDAVRHRLFRRSLFVMIAEFVGFTPLEEHDDRPEDWDQREETDRDAEFESDPLPEIIGDPVWHEDSPESRDRDESAGQVDDGDQAQVDDGDQAQVDDGDQAQVDADAGYPGEDDLDSDPTAIDQHESSSDEGPWPGDDGTDVDAQADDERGQGFPGDRPDDEQVPSYEPTGDASLDDLYEVDD